MSEVAVLGCRHHRHRWLLVSTQQPTCGGVPCVGGGERGRRGLIIKNMWRSNYDQGHLHYKYRNVSLGKWLFTDLNSYPRPWGISFCLGNVTLYLLTVMKTMQWPREGDDLACQHLHLPSLATCPGNKELSLLCWLLGIHSIG